MSKLYKNKFVNKLYRVIPHLDEINQDLPKIEDNKGNEVFDKSFEDYYIPCGRGNSEIYYYGLDTTFGGNGVDEVLCVVVNSYSIGDQVIEELKDYVISSSNNKTEGINAPPNKEYLIYFYDKDLDKFAKLLKANTRGAKTIAPNSDKNLPHDPTPKKKDYRKMPKGWWDDAIVLANKIRAKNSLSVKSTWSYIYDEFSKQVGIDVVTEANKENYKVTHYIHKIGLWEEFEKYMIKEGA